MAMLGMALFLCGCNSSYDHVSEGWQGPTSPAESGLHGASADITVPGPKSEHGIKPIEGPITSDECDPSMEMSGNIAAQGDYKEVVQQIDKQKSPPIL